MTAARKAQAKKKGVLVVNAPLVEVKVGSQVLQFSFGDVLPDGIDEDSLAHLRDLEFVKESEGVESDVADVSGDDD